MQSVQHLNRMKNVGVILRHSRMTSGVSLEQLAIKLGKTKGFLCRVESGARTVSVKYLAEWIEAVNADSDQVYCAAGIVPPDVTSALTLNPQLLREVRELISF